MAQYHNLVKYCRVCGHFVDSAKVIYISDHAATLSCPLCLEVLCQPIELECRFLGVCQLLLQVDL